MKIELADTLVGESGEDICVTGHWRTVTSQPQAAQGMQGFKHHGLLEEVFRVAANHANTVFLAIKFIRVAPLRRPPDVDVVIVL